MMTKPRQSTPRADEGVVEIIAPGSDEIIHVPLPGYVPATAAPSRPRVGTEQLSGNAVAAARRKIAVACEDIFDPNRQCVQRGVVSGLNMAIASFLAPTDDETRAAMVRVLESSSTRCGRGATEHLTHTLREFPDLLFPAPVSAAIRDRHVGQMMRAALLAHEWSGPTLYDHERTSDQWVSLGRRAAFAEAASMWLSPDRYDDRSVHVENAERVVDAIDRGVDEVGGLVALIAWL